MNIFNVVSDFSNQYCVNCDFHAAVTVKDFNNYAVVGLLFLLHF